MPFTQRKRTTCSKNSHLKPKECCACAVAALDQHLTVPIQGRLTQTDLFQALVGMAAMHQSVHSITRFLERVPCETSFRYHLKKLAMDDLEQKSTAILTHFVHHVLKLGNAYQFAIDYTNDPYYGTTSGENESFIIRSKRKKSTNEFYSYVTLYVTTKDRQMTLAVYPVSLCHYFLPSEERLDRSPLDAFLAREAGAKNHRNACVPIQLLHYHNRGSDPGIDGDGERNSRPTASGLEKGRWKDVG